MNEKNFWYIAAETAALNKKKVVTAKILDEWIVLFRDENNQPIALQDRCLHRSSQLSRGKVINGHIQCPYHGWKYNKLGEVTHIPSEGPGTAKNKRKCAIKYSTYEQDGYVYVNLLQNEISPVRPFQIPDYHSKGYSRIRLINHFKNNVTNCVENFVDIPHTVFVHPLIFRKSKTQRFEAIIERKAGSVIVDYKLETSNFGLFSKFLNPSGKEIKHIDSYHFPNITHVEYLFGPKRHFHITSQSVPLNNSETLVYTDLTYNYGLWNWIARPLIRWQGQTIIDQDIDVLDNQLATIEKYGDTFSNSPADTIHLNIESIRRELSEGRDPRLLPEKTNKIEFWV